MNAHAPQKTHIMAKLIIQFCVNERDKILNITIPDINTANAMSNLTLTLKLNIL